MTSSTETPSYHIAGRMFPIPRAYTFHNGGGTAAMVLTAIRTSRRVARYSVSRPEWSIRDRRNHQLPLPAIDDAQARFALLWQESGMPSARSAELACCPRARRRHKKSGPPVRQLNTGLSKLTIPQYGKFALN